jgi:hypothetical protein
LSKQCARLFFRNTLFCPFRAREIYIFTIRRQTRNNLNNGVQRLYMCAYVRTRKRAIIPYTVYTPRPQGAYFFPIPAGARHRQRL